MKKQSEKSWVVKITVLSFIISVAFTLASSEALNGAGYILAFAVLLLFVVLGIVFDMVGTAVAGATEAPFHSMASRRQPGASQALRLLRSAPKVVSICNDVVGDISGIVSGTTAAVLAARLAAAGSVSEVLISVGLSGLVAAATIGGKAAGKSVGLRHSTQIVLTAGRVMSIFWKDKKRRR